MGDLLASFGAVRMRLCLLAVLYDDMGNKVPDGDMGDTVPDDVCKYGPRRRHLQCGP